MASIQHHCTWRPFTGAAPWPSQGRSSRRRQPPALPLLAAAEPQHPAASSSQPAAPGPDPSSSSYEFTYRGSDGRVKATFEQAFKNRVGGSGSAGSSLDSGASSASQERAPWALSYQMSERYSLLWNDDLKARLLKRKAAEQLGMSDEELEERLQRLLLLLPDIRQKLASMRPQLVAALAAQVDEMPGRLMQLKMIFPGANSSLLAMRQPELVLGFDMARLEGIAAELRELLPNLNVDLLVEHNPAMLDVPGLKAAIGEARRIMPGLDVQKQMAQDPQLIFGFQRGSQLIPYDPPRPEDAAQTEADDDEYAAYYGSGV